MFEAFRLGYAAGMGVLAAGATGLILWGLYDLVGGIIISIWITYRHWKRRTFEENHEEPPTL